MLVRLIPEDSSPEHIVPAERRAGRGLRQPIGTVRPLRGAREGEAPAEPSGQGRWRVWDGSAGDPPSRFGQNRPPSPRPSRVGGEEGSARPGRPGARGARNGGVPAGLRRKAPIIMPGSGRGADHRPGPRGLMERAAAGVRGRLPQKTCAAAAKGVLCCHLRPGRGRTPEGALRAPEEPAGCAGHRFDAHEAGLPPAAGPDDASGPAASEPCFPEKSGNCTGP